MNTISCGHCGNKHDTVTEVRECSKPIAPAVFNSKLAWLNRPSILDASIASAVAAPSKTKCLRCAGTGQFVTGTCNGEPTGPGGICFRCEGKGYQTDCGGAAHEIVNAAVKARTRDAGACCDVTRNDLYDRFGIRVYL